MAVLLSSLGKRGANCELKANPREELRNNAPCLLRGLCGGSQTVVIIQITEEQYVRIKDSLPVQRGNVSLSNLQFLNAVLTWPSMGASGAVFRNDLAIGTLELTMELS